VREPGGDVLGRGPHRPPPRPGRTRDGTTALQGVLRAVRRHRWLIAVCALATTAAAAAFALTAEKQYAGSATLLFRSAGVEETVFDSSGQRGDPVREAATNVELGAVDLVAHRTAARLRVPGLTGGAVADQVEISARRDSDLASITATTTDPDLAARMATTFAREYIAFRQESDQRRVREARRSVARQLERLPAAERSGAQGRRLRAELRQLDLLAAVRTGSVELVEPAQRADSPVSPRPKRQIAVGAILGLLLGVALTFVLEQFDRRIKDEEDVERAFGLPVVASIPQARGLGGRGRYAPDLAEDDAEPFRMLRANLRYFNLERELRSVLVTSAGAGEGKSTVAWNLALAEARAGGEVLLIEADLRRPTLARRLELPAGPGLALVLADLAPMSEATVRVVVGEAELDVLAAGDTPPNPAQLLESGHMASLLERAERAYDLVVVDAPAASVPDAIPLVSRVSGVLVVARLRHGRTDLAADLREQLEHLGAPALGVVVNGASENRYAGYGGAGRRG
jgi:receptor protein-tyrosine kinase